ncbi:MAG: hypothetical protein OEW29_01840 [Acidimicrobiia bacterium]|nr:hypothetical protein [Acidimicrobiia bacterium]
MRILRLDFGQGRIGVDLHPFLTVVHGVSPLERDELVDALRRLARGSAAGLHGLLQHQGLLVEMDGSGNGPLAGRALTTADVVVDADAGSLDELPRLQALIDQQQRRAEIDAVVVEEVRADLDPAARACLAVLEARLDPAAEAVLARRRAQATRLRETVAALDGLAPTIQEAPDGVPALRQRWECYQARVDEAEQHFAYLKAAVAQSEARLAVARQALAGAEREARPALLTRDEEARLEMLSFPGMDESRRGKWRRLLRPEEQAEKEALLAKVGVESWTAYTVYRTDPVAPPARIEAAAQARRAVEEAEANLAETRAELETDAVSRELNQELLDIRAASRAHLGLMLPPDLGRALRELVVEKPNPAWLAAMASLRQSLASVDDLPDGVDPSTDDAPLLVGAAGRWLAAMAAADRARDDETFQADLARARRDVDRHRRAMARLPRAEAAAAASEAELKRLRAEAGRHSAGGPLDLDSLLARVAVVATQVAVDARGSLPMVIIGGFAGLGDTELAQVLDRCSQLSGGLQVVVVSDRASARQWAAEAGLERALVSRPKPLAAGLDR